MAAQDGSDRSDCAASSFDYGDFFSTLMYYAHMSKYEILHSSRKFLYAIYQNCSNRACENLGVSPDSSTNSDSAASESEYPSEFVSFSQAEREKEIQDSGETDTDFMGRFSQLKQL